MGTLLLSIGLAAGFTSWQASQARQLRAAQVLGLDNWVRAEAQALHHWLHQASVQASWPTPATRGTARPLTNAEITALEGEYRAPWLKAPAGWEVDYLISNPGDQINAGERAHGILVIRPVAFPDAASTAANPRRLRYARYQLTALCRSLTPEDAATRQNSRLNPGAPAEALAQTAGFTGFGNSRGCARTNTGRAIAVFAAPLAGIDTGLVLREARSGFPPAQMTTGLDMGGNNITGIATLETNGITTATVTPPAAASGPGRLIVAHGLTVEGDLEATGALRATSGQISGDVRVEDRLTAEQLAVTGILRTEGRLTVSGPATGSGTAVLKTGSCRGC